MSSHNLHVAADATHTEEEEDSCCCGHAHYGSSSADAAVPGAAAGASTADPDAIQSKVLGAVRVVRGDLVVVSPTQVLKPGYVVIDATGKVAEVSATAPAWASTADMKTADIIVPGFVDMHNHGVGGHDDVLGFWSRPATTSSILASWGTTSMLATLAIPKTETPEYKHIEESLNALSLVIGKSFPGCAVIEGVHAEGPVVADLGGLPFSDLKSASLESFVKFIDGIPGLKAMTISPKLDAATTESKYGRIKALCERNVLVCLGHDKQANEEEILGALRVVSSYGQRAHVTHVFNVTTFHHRECSLANVAIVPRFPALPQYEGLIPPTMEVIGDTIHVHPMVMQLAISSKPLSDLAFITDAMSPPLPGTRLMYGDRAISVSDAGDRVVLTGTDIMAGSCTVMYKVFVHLVKLLGMSIPDASRVCSTSPASICGLAHVGTLDVGKRADLAALNASDLSLAFVVAGGVQIAAATTNL